MCRGDRQGACGSGGGDSALFTPTVSECLLSLLDFYWIPPDIARPSYQTN
jgi:hypothetical protein